MFPQASYAMTWNELWLNKSPAGDAEIKVTAVARSATTTGSDLVIVTIEGVIPGIK